MSEQLEHMLSGKLYDPSDAELSALRLKAHKLSRQYNNTDEDEEKLRAEILGQLTPNAKPGLFLQGPVYFDYGVFTSFGRNCYANFNFTVLDCCPVTIGDNVFFGRIAACLRLCTLFSVRSAIFAQDLTAAHMIWSTQSRSTSEAIAGLPEMSPYAAV